METPVLTTMVVLYTTGVRFDTDILIHHLPLTDILIKIEKQGVLKRGSSKRDNVRRRAPKEPQRRTTGFGHNSITLVVLSDGEGTLRQKEITVKIFQNGVFHITGVLDERYDRHVMKFLHEYIISTTPTSIVSGEWNEVRRVVLMNYRTKLIGIDNLSRETLYTHLRGKGIKTNYEPAVYPAVKIYFEGKKWIAKVFRTGQVILTGMTSGDECEMLKIELEGLLPASR